MVNSDNGIIHTLGEKKTQTTDTQANMDESKDHKVNNTRYKRVPKMLFHLYEDLKLICRDRKSE